MVNFNELYGQLPYTGCTREVAKHCSRHHNQFWILCWRGTISITKWTHFSRMYWILFVQCGFENRMFSVFFIPEILQYFRVNFSLNVTFDVRQKNQEWLSFTTNLMFAVDYYSQRRFQILQESGKIKGPWERCCQISKNCVTGHKDNHFIVIPCDYKSQVTSTPECPDITKTQSTAHVFNLTSDRFCLLFAIIKKRMLPR